MALDALNTVLSPSLSDTVLRFLLKTNPGGIHTFAAAFLFSDVFSGYDFFWFQKSAQFFIILTNSLIKH